MLAAPRLCSTDSTILLREAYETTYGIYNHQNPDPSRPLALIAMHPAEDATVGSTLHERLEQFADFQVAKHFGLSLNEFFELPSDVCTKILEVSAKRQNVEGSTATQMLNQLEANK